MHYKGKSVKVLLHFIRDSFPHKERIALIIAILSARIASIGSDAACSTDPNQGQDCLPDMHGQTAPCSDDPLQIGVKGCQGRTIKCAVLQRICSAPALAEVATAIAVSSYGDFVRRFKSSRPDFVTP